MLEKIEHPERGRITGPTTPLRLDGLGRCRPPRALLSARQAEIDGGGPGSPEEIAGLKARAMS